MPTYMPTRPVSLVNTVLQTKWRQAANHRDTPTPTHIQGTVDFASPSMVMPTYQMCGLQ